MRSHPLGGYIALAYAGSWILWLPALLGQKNPRLLSCEFSMVTSVVLNQLALFVGPFLASLVATRLMTGLLRNWMASLLRWRVPLMAYLLTLVTIPTTMIAVLAILPSKAAGGLEPTGPALVIAPLVMGVAYLTGESLQEEVEWRGFTLPRPQEYASPLPTAVILGIVWGGWHLSLFLTAEQRTIPHRGMGDPFTSLTFTVTASIVLSWITSTARGPVLLAIFTRNAVDRALSVWGKVAGQKMTSLWSAVLGLVVLAVIVVTVTRDRLRHRGT